MKGEATDGINGGFTENDGTSIFFCDSRRDGKETEVFAGSGSHAPPMDRGCSAKFASHCRSVISKKKEDGIGSDVCIENTRFDERINQCRGNGALSSEVGFDSPELNRIPAEAGSIRAGTGNGFLPAPEHGKNVSAASPALP